MYKIANFLLIFLLSSTVQSIKFSPCPVHAGFVFLFSSIEYSMLTHTIVHVMYIKGSLFLFTFFLVVMRAYKYKKIEKKFSFLYFCMKNFKKHSQGQRTDVGKKESILSFFSRMKIEFSFAFMYMMLPSTCALCVF
jgi:hypothetical protein